MLRTKILLYILRTFPNKESHYITDKMSNKILLVMTARDVNRHECRQAARVVKPLIVMIISEYPSNCIALDKDLIKTTNKLEKK